MELKVVFVASVVVVVSGRVVVDASEVVDLVPLLRMLEKWLWQLKLLLYK